MGIRVLDLRKVATQSLRVCVTSRTYEDRPVIFAPTPAKRHLVQAGSADDLSTEVIKSLPPKFRHRVEHRHDNRVTRLAHYFQRKRVRELDL